MQEIKRGQGCCAHCSFSTQERAVGKAPLGQMSVLLDDQVVSLRRNTGDSPVVLNGLNETLEVF